MRRFDEARAASSARFLKMIIAQAAEKKATKVVLGMPCEAECPRVPYVPHLSPRVPWEDEDKARFSGRSEQELAEGRIALKEWYLTDVSERRSIPLWFKVGQTYEEFQALPAHLLFDFLSAARIWNFGSISWEGEKPDWQKVADLPRLPPGQDALSSFFLRLESGRVIRASLGFEPSFCLSISIHDTGRSI